MKLITINDSDGDINIYTIPEDVDPECYMFDTLDINPNHVTWVTVNKVTITSH